jgi:DnaJ-class molecular chaperone
MDYQDYYQTLGVPRTASQAEIKKAFRKLARDHHPDRNPGDKAAERRFKDVNEAHAVLADPEKRKKYDALGADWAAYERAGARAGTSGDPFGPGGPFAGFARAGGQGQGANVRYEFRTSGPGDAGFSDFFRMFFSGAQAGEAAGTGRRNAAADRASRRATGGPSFQDILGDMGLDGTAGNASTAPREPARHRARAGEIEALAELSLEEAFHGTSRVVEVQGKRYEVQIPRGVDTGSRVKLSGKGPDGRDVVVVVRLRRHAVFTRNGADLERELPVTLGEALLGAEVPVSTLKGRVLLTIPAGTQNGKTIRLSGQGMPKVRDGGAGNLYVKIRVALPTDLDEPAREAARRFLDLVDQPDPRPTTT